jgi:hypothetical protein
MRNRIVLTVLPLTAAAVAFWLLAVAPKRQEASDIERDVADLQAQVDEQEELAQGAEAAREDFPRAYRRVVVLGKAAPEDDDTSSLLVQLNRVADRAGVEFISLETQDPQESGAAAPPATDPPPESEVQSEEEPEGPAEGSELASSATPTEASAALLPIGAAIGPAGLPVMKYSLIFDGDFFALADFLEGLDEMVKSHNDGTVGVRGRLITVDGFELTPPETDGPPSPDPSLSASLNITTFLTPPDEGLTAGASPAGPAPATEPQPTSTTTPPSSTATASTTTP